MAMTVNANFQCNILSSNLNGFLGLRTELPWRYLPSIPELCLGVVCTTVHIKPTQADNMEVLSVPTMHNKYYLCLHCTSIICTYTAPQVLSVPTLHHKYYLYLHCKVLSVPTMHMYYLYLHCKVLSVSTMHKYYLYLQCTASIICTYTSQVLSVPTLHHKYYLYLHCTTSTICTYTTQVLSVPTLHKYYL